MKRQELKGIIREQLDHLFELKKSAYKFDLFADGDNKKTKSIKLTGDHRELQSKIQKIADKDDKFYTAYVGDNKWDEFHPKRK